MHWNDHIALVGFSVAAVGMAAHRRLLLAAAFACLAGYTLFDKALPGTLPTSLDILFPLAALYLVARDFRTRRRLKSPRTRS